MTRTALIGMLVLLVSTSAFSQQVPSDDPVASAPVRIGRLGIGPRVSVKNLGVDTNVFNVLDDKKRDFTFTVSPGTDLWLRTGRGLLSISGDLDFVYFHEYESERSLNSNASGQYEFRFNRLRPYVLASTLDTRERPGYEIDARARRFENVLSLGAEFRIASKSFVQLRARRQRINFAGDAVFQGQKLDDLLGHTSAGIDLEWRQRLTGLTTWIVRASRERDRFGDTPERNSNSNRIVTGVELGRFALIRGEAFVGFRHMVGAEDSQLPSYSGLVAKVNVAYTAPTQTRLGLQVDRDLQYSYAPEHPYYVDTGWSVSLTQRIVGRWDVQLVGGRHRLAYRQVAPVVIERGVDRIETFGGGVGYQVGENTRVSFDIQSQQRISLEANRSFSSFRSGVSVTYGF